jgi:uncharacterized Fe-S radical SAM superfamily protein PflX
MREERSPQYLRARTIETDADLSAPTEGLWRIHDYFATGEQKETAVTTASLLDLKIEIAQRMCGYCHFCERRCYTNRAERPGFCGVLRSKYSSEFLHYGEERELVSSHTIFLRAARLSALSVKTGISHDMRRRVRSLMPMHLHGESTHDQSQEPAT